MTEANKIWRCDLKSPCVKFCESENDKHLCGINRRNNMLKEKPKKVCEVCGTTEKVKVRAEPYQLEINNKKVKVIVCPKCYKEMEQEI